MAALLEAVLQERVKVEEVLCWLRDNTGAAFTLPSDVGAAVCWQQFVPFLLNFLREQSSYILTNAPAKTPTFCDQRPQAVPTKNRVQLFSPAPALSPVAGVVLLKDRSVPGGSGWSPGSRGSTPRISLGDFMVSPNEGQMRGRKRSGGACQSQGRHSGGRGQHHENTNRQGGRRSSAGGPSETVVQLNFSSLEDFPPVGASPTPSASVKPSRRINPTPVIAERPLNKPKSCFTSTPYKQCSPAGAADGTCAAPHGCMPSLQEERELLRKEKCKIAQQASSPLLPVLDASTPTKLHRVAQAEAQVHAQPAKVTFPSELHLLACLYSTCIAENLVPSIFLELFFVLQLLTLQVPVMTLEEEIGKDKLILETADVLDRQYLRSLHNCVYFAVKVLEDHSKLLCHLDQCLLRLLRENERVASFSAALREKLTQAQESRASKGSPVLKPFIQCVPFQPTTDNRSNFSSDRAFHTFKKQRDIFYELLREWEDKHREPGWDFEHVMGNRVRIMVAQLTSTGNHLHFARLFQKQLLQMCKSSHALDSPADVLDPDLLGLLGRDSLCRLKRLEERFIRPQGPVGPCPPPSFPGYQEFFRDFLQNASSCQLNQHLTDSLCRELLELDEVSILGGSLAEGDLEQQNERQRFCSMLLTSRLLAKFLGFITFLPYQTNEPPSREIQEAALTVRNKSSPVLDIHVVLRSCVRRQTVVLTVPWVVEFLSMMDFCGPFLQCYRNALAILLRLYRTLALSRDGGISYLNRMLLVAVLGWLFQIPVFPEDLFFRIDIEEEMGTKADPSATLGLDSVPLVDLQVLYFCCPYLSEYRKLLALFVAGSTAKSSGLMRKITPTSADPREARGGPSQHTLQVELEQAFFHNQPPSLRRTLEFVAERVGSNCVKNIKATLVLELVQGGEAMLRERLSDSTSVIKLNDSVCAQLCEQGQRALELAKRYCREKGPGAVRVLLPEETSPNVLATSEIITVRLATDKACSWLSSNITGLIQREWKEAFHRLMKTQQSPSEATETSLVDQGRARGSCVWGRSDPLCPAGCTHKKTLPSEVINDIKEMLCIAVGPRSEEEWLKAGDVEHLLRKAEETLSCREFLTPTSEQMLLHCTVLLACKLVCGELPVTPGPTPAPSASRPLLQQLVNMWGQSLHLTAPVDILFTEITLSALLQSGEAQWQDFKFLTKCLQEKRLLTEEVLNQLKNMSGLLFSAQSMKRFQELLSSLHLSSDNKALG